ncbi:hypothetical protein [Undibacterium sp. Ji22W]|uniref:hypothetical protein n=1 Tax=Undibacterium sp. Ji22W TaxID=3413038 RepID=UPI003BF0DCD4
MNFKTPSELLKILEDKVAAGATASEIFIYLHQNEINSFTNKNWSMPMLNHCLLTLKNPDYRASSILAQLIKQREIA